HGRLVTAGSQSGKNQCHGAKRLQATVFSHVYLDFVPERARALGREVWLLWLIVVGASYICSRVNENNSIHARTCTMIRATYPAGSGSRPAEFRPPHRGARRWPDAARTKPCRRASGFSMPLSRSSTGAA